MTDAKNTNCVSVNRSMLVPVGLLHDYADMLETTGRDASTVRSVADSLAQTECRSISQETIEDAWSVATWHLEALKLENDADGAEAATCRRLLRAIPRDRVPWIHPNQKLEEQAPATEQESESGVVSRLREALALADAMSGGGGPALVEPDDLRVAIQAMELCRAKTTECRSVSREDVRRQLGNAIAVGSWEMVAELLASVEETEQESVSRGDTDSQSTRGGDSDD